MAAAAILKNLKSRYLGNGLTDRHEIWHGDAIRHLWCVPQLKICKFKTAAILKNWKIALSRPQIQAISTKFGTVSQFDHRDHLVRYKFEIVKNPRLRPPTSWKIQNYDIWERLSRSAQHLARWRILALRTRPAVENLELLKIQDGGRPPSWKIDKC